MSRIEAMRQIGTRSVTRSKTPGYSAATKSDGNTDVLDELYSYRYIDRTTYIHKFITRNTVKHSLNQGRDIYTNFTAQCTIVQSAVLRLHVVRPSVCVCPSVICLSVCLSVTLVDQDHRGWKSWKLIAWTITPTSSLFVV